MVGDGRAPRPFSHAPSSRPQSFQAFLTAFTDTVHARGLAAVAPPPPVLPPAARLVAVGDLHGDLPKTRRALKLAGVLGDDGRWCGGKATLVQVGDILDRGGDEVAILYLLERLSKEAAAAGGAVHVLLGNHETLNVAGRYRYASPSGRDECDRVAAVDAIAAAFAAKCGCREPPAAQGGRHSGGAGRLSGGRRSLGRHGRGGHGRDRLRARLRGRRLTPEWRWRRSRRIRRVL